MTSTRRSVRRWATAAALCARVPALAATVLGTVLLDSGQPAAKLPVQLSCGDKAVASTTTDAQGGYRLTVSGAGRCQLKVEGASAELILSNQAPAQHDFKPAAAAATGALQRR